MVAQNYQFSARRESYSIGRSDYLVQENLRMQREILEEDSSYRIRQRPTGLSYRELGAGQSFLFNKNSLPIANK